MFQGRGIKDVPLQICMISTQNHPLAVELLSVNSLSTLMFNPTSGFIIGDVTEISSGKISKKSQFILKFIKKQ